MDDGPGRHRLRHLLEPPALRPRARHTAVPRPIARGHRSGWVAALVFGSALVASAAVVAAASSDAPSRPAARSLAAPAAGAVPVNRTGTDQAPKAVTVLPPVAGTTGVIPPATRSADPTPRLIRPAAVPTPVTTHEAPAPVADPHHVFASIHASSLNGQLTVLVSVTTDADSASVVVHASNAAGEHTAITGGRVSGSVTFSTSLTVADGPVSVYAVVTTTFGTATTGTAHLQA